MLIRQGSALTDRRFRARWVDAVVLDGPRLEHYRRRLDRPDRPWAKIGTVTEQATGPGRLSRAGRDLLVEVPEGDRSAAYRLEATGWLPTSDPNLQLDARERPETPSAADLGADSGHLRAVATFVASG